jgi:hypothetical protein
MNVDDPLELLEANIWNAVRRAIKSGEVVRVLQAATHIAAGQPSVMSVNAIAELLADAALAAGLPIDVEGLPLTSPGSHGCANSHARTGAILRRS